MLSCHPNIIQSPVDEQPTLSNDSLPDPSDTGKELEASIPVREGDNPPSGQSDIAPTDTPATPQQTLSRFPSRNRKPPDRLTL